MEAFGNLLACELIGPMAPNFVFEGFDDSDVDSFPEFDSLLDLIKTTVEIAKSDGRFDGQGIAGIYGRLTIVIVAGELSRDRREIDEKRIYLPVDWEFLIAPYRWKGTLEILKADLSLLIGRDTPLPTYKHNQSLEKSIELLSKYSSNAFRHTGVPGLAVEIVGFDENDLDTITEIGPMINVIRTLVAAVEAKQAHLKTIGKQLDSRMRAKIRLTPVDYSALGSLVGAMGLVHGGWGSPGQITNGTVPIVDLELDWTVFVLSPGYALFSLPNEARATLNRFLDYLPTISIR